MSEEQNISETTPVEAVEVVESTPPAEKIKKTEKKADNSLLDILINVIIPVLILSYLSKDEGKLWHLGPELAMSVALLLPLGFGVWHYIRHKKINLLSAIGLIAILCTGLITIYLFYYDSARVHVGMIFGIKEAVIPLTIGSLFIVTHKKKTPLLTTFLYNDGLFDIKGIEKKVKAKDNQSNYNTLLWRCTLIMFGSFCVSAAANLFLSLYFFRDLSPTISNWKEEYNVIVGKITGYGFLVIGLPFVFILAFILYYLLKNLRAITGLNNDEILNAR